MRRSLLLSVALAGTALAQTPPVQTPPVQAPPVQPAQAPEDRVARPTETAQPLPPPAPTGTPPAGAADAKAAKGPEKWDVNAPRGLKLREVAIKVTEGSWMNVDVSPDGKTIAFDLLGDIYTMAIAGGTPTRIASGLAYEQQPRFSPDGRRIAFVSDRGGGDNIWLMNTDGSDKRQLTKEDFRLLNQPSWSPDGRFIVAKKHFTTGRSLGTGEVWLYHVSGGGGVPLVKRPNETHQKELGEPIYAPDGKGIYFTRNITPGPIFEYAQDSNTDLFDIERYDLATGETAKAVTGVGGSVRPTPSPDGRYIAFVRRERTKSKLYIRDLKSGEERKLYDALDQDVQETWAVTGVYPNMAWTPDSQALVFWAGGHIVKAPLAGAASVIPFRIDDTRTVADALHPTVAVAPDRFTTRMPRWAEVSPDGRQVVFETLGKLWVKPMAGGEPRRLTNAGDGFELWPSWSRDGKSIAFVGWTDAGLGRVRVVPAGGGAARDVTSEPGHYARPHFSPDGRTLVFEATSGGSLVSDRWGRPDGVYRVAVTGGAPVQVAKDAALPQFGADGSRVFMVANEKGKRQLISTDLDGEAKRVHAAGELVNAYAVSPDGQYFAFRQNYEAFVMPLMPGGQEVNVDPKGGPLPVTRVSADGADFIHWTPGAVHWSNGPTLYSAPLTQLFPNAPAAGDDKPAKFAAPKAGVSLAMTVPAARPSGAIALTGARLVTMAGWSASAKDGGIIDDGVIVITGDRITAIGKRGSVAIPAGARTIDVTGKTIIPGLVDAHAHGPQAENGVVPQQNWSLMANLAMGTTTIHDPSQRPAQVFPAAELQRAGQILGPRIFSTGEIVYGAKQADVYAEINSYEDALAHVRRLKAQGAISIKNYNQPRREQRQMLVAATQAEGLEVVPEGGSLYNLDLTHILDGNSTVEHNVPLMHFYDDLVSLWRQTTTNYTPTLVVTYGGPAGDPYWRAHTDVWKHPILSQHEPPGQLAADNVRRTLAAEEDYVDDDSAREAKKIADAGRMVSIGAHGQQTGLGPHWELWSFVRGGWSPLEALAAGTIMPATSLGMARDIGSLEAGKLADLVILDADPTQDIRNSDKVAQVMLGGRLYDARTLNEVAPGAGKRPAYWWTAGGTPSSGGRAAAASHGFEDQD